MDTLLTYGDLKSKDDDDGEVDADDDDVAGSEDLLLNEVRI